MHQTPFPPPPPPPRQYLPPMSMGGMPEPPAGMPMAKGRTSPRLDEFDYEGLERDNFADTAWVPPSTTLAQTSRRNSLFGNGTQPVCGTAPHQLGVMGVGITLYFRMLKALGFACLIMFVLALPALVINMSGDRIQNEERDVVSTSFTTLGNQGFAVQLGANATSACARGTSANCNVTIVTVLGYELDSRHAAYVITASDLAYSLFFLFFIAWWRRSVGKTVDSIQRDTLTSVDYTVRVRGLPRDATEAEIVQHFSRLYQLSAPDWTDRGHCCGLFLRKRARPPPLLVQPAFAQPTPPEQASAAGSMYNASPWVAQVVVAHPNGDAIRAFKSAATLALRLREARARVKMWSPGTPLHGGPNEALRKHALVELQQLQRRMDRLQFTVRARMGRRLSECIGAYVVFKYRESFRRCLADYQGAQHWYWRALQPRLMRFRNRLPLVVTPAPEPSNILWENLATSPGSRFVRQVGTSLLTLLLLAVSFAFVYVAMKEKEKYSQFSASLGLCRELPATLFGGVEEVESTALARFPALESSCPSGHFYLTYPGAPTNYDDLGQPPECVRPCVSAIISENVTCTTPACQHPALKAEGYKCWRFAPSVRIACFCRQLVGEALSHLSTFDGVQNMVAGNADMCAPFAQQFVTAQLLSMVACVAVVVINTALKSVLRAVSTFEHHHSVSAEARAVLIKVFVAQFLNTALIILIVRGRPPNGHEVTVLRKLGLLSGDLDSFSVDWYTTVGASLILTMIMNVVVPHVVPLLQYCCVRPWRVRRHAHKQITQRGLNLLYEGPEFMIASRIAIALNTLFVTLAYSSGMPLLLLLAAVAFGTCYWVDMLLVLRYYRRPPQYDEALALLAGRLMPLALVLHLAFGVWMYGNNEILHSDMISPKLIARATGKQPDEALHLAYDDYVESLSTRDPLGIVPTVLRANCFPLALLLALVVLSLLLGNTLLPLIKAALQKLHRVLCCGWCRRSSKLVPLTPEEEAAAQQQAAAGPRAVRRIDATPGFTDIYTRQVNGMDSLYLTEAEQQQGWRVQRLGPSRGLRYKVWTTDGRTHGYLHARGLRKRTWEVIRDQALHSYAMEDNPVYRDALKGKQEGSVIMLGGVPGAAVMPLP